MAWTFARVFAGTCEVGVVGIIAAAIHYRNITENIPTDDDSTMRSFENFKHSTAYGHNEMYDVAIVGGGIVGTSTAREIREKYPNKKVLLLEMESSVAQHQSGHNSGCIHAGMYYKPGTAMSRLCPRGHDLIIDYCRKHNLPYELCGKMIVAAKPEEVKTVEQLYEYGKANNVQGLEMLRSQEEIHQKEPLVKGVAALWSPNTGITDFAEITRHMFSELCKNSKNHFTSVFQFQALDFVGVHEPNASSGAGNEYVIIRGREKNQHGPEKSFIARHVITCCGLSNDTVAKHSGNVLERVGNRIVQTYCFRGQYYQVRADKRSIVRMHIYPSPDMSKGLSVGVHVTPTVDVNRGRQLILGPGSAVASARYGYSPYNIDIGYCLSCAFSKGGWESLFSNFGSLLQTYYIDLSKKAFLREAQKIIPTLTEKDIEVSFTGVMGLGVLEKGGLCSDLAMEFCRPRVTVPASVDVQSLAITPMSKNMPPTKGVVDNEKPLILNIRNAPSPAATSAMSIAEEIVSNASTRFAW